MARASPTVGSDRPPAVHNDGSATVSVRVVVRGPTVSAEVLTLAPTETATVEAAPTAAIEVHAAGGSATAPAHATPTFVVREGSVLVATE